MIKNLSFRMFVSSTFRDFEEERNILTQNIYPRLLSYCREHNSNFQAIDMRWGISREYNLENAVLPICLEEIEQCKAYGTFPNFLIMLGDRYGWCPPPYEIVAEELDMILRSATEEEKNSILEWYIKDNNACIPRYCLKKRDGIYKEENEWYKKENELHDVLYSLALKSGIDEYALQKYYTSATEQEIISGLFDDPIAREHVVVLRKDVAPQDSMEEEVKRARLLKERVCSYVPSEHIIDIDEKGEYQERVYELLLAEIKERFDLYGSVDKQKVEEYLQADFVSDNQKCYCNREEEEEKLVHFLAEYDGKVKCICGESGTGKTSLLSHLVTNSDDSWIYVFAGASSKSQNILEIIEYFYWNVKNKGVEIRTFEKQYETAVLQFELMLKELPADKTWKFLVDGLDNVHDLNRLLQGFLSIKVPAHVVVAASFVSPYSLEESRNGLINKVHNIAKLTQMQPWNILQKKLESVSRTLTEEQKKFVINKIENNPLPIYVDLISSIVSKWKSWDVADERIIKDDYAETVNALFDDLILRQRVGEIFLRHSIGYFCNVEYGLQEDEIIKLLSDDEEVMSEIIESSQWEFDIEKGIPFILWARLWGFLKDFFVRCNDAMGVLCFGHNLFREAADKWSSNERMTLLHNIKKFYMNHSCYYVRPEAAWILGVPNERKIQELIPNLYKLNDLKTLYECLSDNHFCNMYIMAGKLNELYFHLSGVQSDCTEEVIEKIHLLSKIIRTQYKTLEYDRESFWPLLHEYYVKIEDEIPSVWLNWQEVEQGIDKLQINDLLSTEVERMSISENGILIGVHQEFIRLYDLNKGIPLNNIYVFDYAIKKTSWIGNTIYVLTEKEFCVLEYLDERIVFINSYLVTGMEDFCVSQDGRYAAVYKCVSNEMYVVDLKNGKVETLCIPIKGKKHYITCVWISAASTLAVHCRNVCCFWSIYDKCWKQKRYIPKNKRKDIHSDLCTVEENKDQRLYWVRNYSLISGGITGKTKRKYEFRFAGCRDLSLRISPLYSFVISDKRNLSIFSTETGGLLAQLQTDYNIENALFSESGEKLVLIYTKNRIEMINVSDYAVAPSRYLFRKRWSIKDLLWRKRDFLEPYVTMYKKLTSPDLREQKAKYAPYSHAQQAVVNINGDYVALYFPDVEKVRIVRLSTKRELAHFFVEPFKLKELKLPCMSGCDNGKYLAICYCKYIKVLSLEDLKWIYTYEHKKGEIKKVIWEKDDLWLGFSDGTYGKINLLLGKIEIHKESGPIVPQESESVKIYKEGKQKEHLVFAKKSLEDAEKMKFLYHADLVIQEKVFGVNDYSVYVNATDNTIYILDALMNNILYKRVLSHDILAADMKGDKIVLVSDEAPYIMEAEVWCYL